MEIVRGLLRLLSRRERRQVLLLLPLLCLNAVLEVVGVASIMPFLAIVADPAAVEKHEILTWLYEAGGFEDTRGFLFAIGVLMFLFVVGSNLLNAFTSWAVLRFSWMRNYTVAVRLLRTYLAKPYSFFLDRHSSDLGRNLVVEVQNVIVGVLVPAMQGLAKVVAAIAIMGLLFYVDPLLALLTGLVLGGAYGVAYLMIRRQQRRIGLERLGANKDRFAVLAEAFGGVKEVKLLGREAEILRRFREPSHVFSRTTARNAVVGMLPRYVFEIIAFGGILLMVLYLLGSDQPLHEILPILGLYAFSGYRLMPSLQVIFQGITNIRFNATALEHLLQDLPPVGEEPTFPDEPPEPLHLARSIRLRDVRFQYPTAPEPLFRDLNLEIAAGTSVGFVGKTGSGKSTLCDMILGLLRPDGGLIEIDGKPLTNDRVRSWQRNLGYVPQAIFLADDTIARNIAFGLADEHIDRDAVVRAAKAASIDDFIEEELPDGYETVVGERGIRLSGGQRQRIGIARALYTNPEVIVFDEATSALDGVTEEQVLQAVNELSRDRTVLMIAHRLSTVRACDQIVMLTAGEVTATGTYDELIGTSEAFRALADVSRS